MQKLLGIVGPTANGKTSLALKLAKRFNGELVSCDSRQIYTGMDIGTGKDLTSKKTCTDRSITVHSHEKEYVVTPYEEQGILIWMYDVVNPNEEFSVSHYASLASKVISSIHSRGKLPIVVGGTGLYYQAITQGIGSIDVPPDDTLRESLFALSTEALQQLLQKEAFTVWQSMNHSDQNNPRRLVRKIELVRSGFSFPDPEEKAFDVLSIGLRLTDSEQNARIADRVRQRIEQGSVKEVKHLVDIGYSFQLPSMQTMGYQEWQDYLAQPTQEKYALAEKLWVLHETQYAKRQMTWFSKDASMVWFQASQPDLEKLIGETISLWYTRG